MAYVVPRDGDTLNAKKWLGGRAALSRMQSDFAEKVARHHELERGIEGSRAHHQSIRTSTPRSRSRASTSSSARDGPAQGAQEGFLTSEYETPEMVAERLTASVQKAYTPAVEAAKLAASESRRADEMTLTAQTLSREKKRLRSACRPCKSTLRRSWSWRRWPSRSSSSSSCTLRSGSRPSKRSGRRPPSGKARPGTTAPGG